MSHAHSGRVRRSGLALLALVLTSTTVALSPSPLSASAPAASSAGGWSAGGSSAARATALAAVADGRAPIVVGNADDGPFSGVVDILRPGDPEGFPSGLDEDDGMAVGDVTGDGIDEVVVVDDDERRVDVHDTRPGDTFGDVLFGWESRFDAEEDAIAIGNVTDDPASEIVVADEALGQFTIYRADGDRITSFFGNTGYDADDDMVVGNVTGGPLDEILIVNSEDEGRVDALEADGDRVATIRTGFDGNSDDVAAGNVMGDAHDDVVVANDEDGNRIESHDVTGDEVANLNNTAYDSDDRIGVGAVNATGTDEIVIANTEQSGRLDIIDFEVGTTEQDSGYDGDDRFAIGTVGGGDIDADGIPDQIELDGIRDADGDLVDGWDLDDLGASPCRADVLVEADYMDASGAATGPHNHRPDQGAIDEVVAAFDAAPVSNPIDDCPYPGEASGDGIGLHVVVDDSVAEQDELGGRAGFEAIKAEGRNFDAALDPYVHYALFAHEKAGESIDGLADFTGDLQDFAMFLGSGSGQVGSPENQASTFMHELGHALGLGHGGGDTVNQKPNYVSVMNYSYAVEGAPDFGVLLDNGDRARDLSRAELAPLAKTQLSEPAGIGVNTGFQTLWYDDAGIEHVEVADGPLDWDFDGDDTETVEVNINRDDGGLCVEEDPTDADKTLSTTADPDDVVVTFDGFEDIHGGPDLICDTTASGGDLQSVPVGTEQILTGFDDWADLDLLHGTPGGSTALRPPKEMTEAEMAEITAAWDRELFPDASVALDAPRPGFHAASLGVATDEQHVYAVHSYRTVTNPATSDRPGSLVILDKDTLEVQKRIAVGFGPRSVAVDPVRDRAYVTNSGQEDYSISVIDTVSQEVVGEVEIGQVPIDVALNVGLNRIYVSNPFQQRIEVIDGATLTKLAPITVGPAIGIAVDESRDTVYAALSRRPGTPNLPAVAALGTVIDDGISRPRVLAPTPLGDFSLEPVDVSVDAAGDRLFLAGVGSATAEPPSLVVVDQDSRQVVEKIRNRGPVRAVAVHAEAGLVAAVGDRGIDLYDLGQRDLRRRIDVGSPFSVAVGPGGSRQLYVGDFLSGQLHRRSLTSGVSVD